MNWLTKAVLISLFIFALLAGAHSQQSDEDAVQTQAHGYWVDPATGLM